MKAVVQELVAAAGIDTSAVAQPFEHLCRQFSEQNI
jgi:hypothetical protein